MKHLLKLFLAIVVLSFFFLPTATALEVTVGPYLQNSSDDSMTIVWRSDIDAEGVVRFGTSFRRLDRAVTAVFDGVQYVARIDDLAPDTRYFYSIEMDGLHAVGADSDHRFVTHPTTGTSKPFSFWVVGDSGTGSAIQAEVRDAMLRETDGDPPDLFLHMGDMAYTTGTDLQFQAKFFAMYDEILRNTVVWPTLGNHEAKSANSAAQVGPYYDVYVLPRDGESGGLASGTEAYYSFDYGDVHFVVLDSAESNRSVGGRMLTWLAADLAATDQRWLIAYWHHPPYSRGSHNSDTEGALINMRENAVPILEAAGVDLVMSGHSHTYERSFLLHGAYDTPSTTNGILDPQDGRIDGDGPYRKSSVSDGAIYVVAGHGGTALRKRGEHPVMFTTEIIHGSCVVDVRENSLRLKNIRHTGVISDSVTIVKTDGVAMLYPRADEHLTVNNIYTIRWGQTDRLRPIDLDLSLNGGETWQPIARRTLGESYRWQVPGVTSTEAMIRVSASHDPSLSDISDPFYIDQLSTRTAIPFGSKWRYSDLFEPGWNDTTFDDETWPIGHAQFGYGEGDEATLLTDADPNNEAAFFRTTFQTSDPVLEARFEAIVDDAAAIWINGALVYRMDTFGSVEPSYALAEASENQVIRGEIAVSRDLFRRGENTIAVMVKQSDPLSNDLSFDLRLEVTESHGVLDSIPRFDAQKRSLDATSVPVAPGRTIKDLSPIDPDDPLGVAGGSCSIVDQNRHGKWWALLALLIVFARRRRWD